MSGLAVAHGQADRRSVDEMLSRMAHRGPYLSGVDVLGKTAMAQNYLRADVPGAPGDAAVPAGAGTGGPRICYDGQMGNAPALAAALGLTEGPFLEERVVLELYRREGPRALDRLDDAVFAFVISDGDEVFAARDVFGIKTLFYGFRDGSVYFASEIKSLLAVTEDVHEFPPGHYRLGFSEPVRFAALPESPPSPSDEPVEEIAARVRDIVRRSLRSRIDFAVPTGSLLSGGLDSSIISWLATELLREQAGPDARLKTFSMGLGVSEDIKKARLMAEHIRSEHNEVVVDVEAMFEALPEVIYHLESFDPSLVRSSVANFLISRHAARNGAEVLLSGEGGDEMFCGYAYMAAFPPEELFREQMACFAYLHNNASLRLDRMNHSNSVRVVAPFVSGELFRYMLTIPPQYKLRPEGKIEKWILRKAFESALPAEITSRVKEEFSEGSGVVDHLPARIEPLVGDAELAQAQASYPFIRTKEELYYFRLFTEHFGTGHAMRTVGQWLNP